MSPDTQFFIYLALELIRLSPKGDSADWAPVRRIVGGVPQPSWGVATQKGVLCGFDYDLTEEEAQFISLLPQTARKLAVFVFRLVAENERLRQNVGATQDEADAAAEYDQIRCVLDGYPVEDLRPAARRVFEVLLEAKALREEVERLTNELSGAKGGANGL